MSLEKIKKCVTLYNVTRIRERYGCAPQLHLIKWKVNGIMTSYVVKEYLNKKFVKEFPFVFKRPSEARDFIVNRDGFINFDHVNYNLANFRNKVQLAIVELYE